MIRRSWSTTAAVIWTLAIFLGTWLPRQHIPHPELEGASFFRFLPLDKIVHTVLFAGFAFLWLLAGRTSPGLLKRVLFFGLLLAILTELGQATPWVGRDAELNDVFADSLGLLLGVGLYRSQLHRKWLLESD